MAEYFCPVIRFILKFKLIFVSSVTQIHLSKYPVDHIFNFMLNQQHPMIILYWTFLLHSLTLHTCMRACVTGTQRSWTNCAQSTQVWWKSWQTATASCSRRSTRGSHWRSTISRTCPSWRYSNPDAHLYWACASASCSQSRNWLNPKIPALQGLRSG